MNRILRTSAALALIACLLLVLAGCSTAGRYKLVEMYYEGTRISAREANIDPDEYYLELASDGTAILCIDDDLISMEWADGQIWAVGEDDSKAPLTIEDDLLTMEVDGIRMVFEKD